MTTLPRDVDLAIVGAGAAGLAAAHAAAARGLSAVVLEAAHRMGGRAHTDLAALGLPFDRGCSWMHSGSLNPFPAVADRFGFTYRREPVPRRIFLDGGWADDAEWADWRAWVDAGLAAAKAAGLSGRDVAAATVMRMEGRWSALFDAWLGMSGAVNANALSTRDYASYRDTAENWPVREGFGALVARWGEGLPVILATPVQSIRWDGPGVRLETRRGTLAARAAIVTVSTGILSAGAIRFDPPLPDWKLSAIDGLPLGAANKVALRFAQDVFGDIESDSFAAFSTATASAMSVQVRPFGLPMTVGYVGGRFADSLEPEGPAAAIALAVEQHKAMFGSDIAREITAASSTAWRGDPLIRGAYSAARPGMAHLRADLARPVADRLFFAGEATSTEFYSTVHGACFSGRRAVDEAVSAAA